MRPLLNPHYLSILEAKKRFEIWQNERPILDPNVLQTALTFDESDDVNYKTLHPLFIRSYKMPFARFGQKPLHCLGLDVETEATLGECRLIGISYGDSVDQIEYPTLETFFAFCESTANNTHETNFVTWGTLDIQVLIRLFNPTEYERRQISRGISANVVHGQFVGDAPLIRYLGKDKTPFYVGTYLPGRAVKFGFIDNKGNHNIWVYNLAQFYNARIADTAKALKLPWKDFAKETHLINWKKYKWSARYRRAVLKSNEQDAITVQKLADKLQERYADAFNSYPRLLVSAGSLTDAAVSKILKEDENPEEYNSTSWAWLCETCYTGKDQKNLLVLLDEFLAEAFSAGYVDQFAVGYFPTACTADISSAYPYQIRKLHDLRNAHFEYGETSVDLDTARHERAGWFVESAIIRGMVTIPNTLRFHPITTRTPQHENYRPQGTFEASYTLEERQFCEERGASFEDEEYIFILLPADEIHEASISHCSVEIGAMRDRLRGQLADELRTNGRDTDLYRVLDGQQFLVKVVDNSIYGKMVMTTEIVENVDDGSGTVAPHIVGYTTGDRYNLLYGALTTARTRIRLATAMNAILVNGGKPIMAMTDSCYWEGSTNQLPIEMTRPEKTAGYFEPAHEIKELYILKTGQYEYRTGRVWEHKLRGLRLDRAQIGNKSFYRKIIKNYCEPLNRRTNPKSMQIPLSTHRLISIGSQDLSHLGMIEDGKMFLAPFVMSTKEANRYIKDWHTCLDSHVWLPAKQVQEGARQFAFLDMLYEDQENDFREHGKESKKVQNLRARNNKRHLVYNLTEATGLEPPQDWLQKSTTELLEFYGQGSSGKS